MKVHQNHLEGLLKQIAWPLNFLIQQVQKKMLLNTLEHVLPGPSWEHWGLESPYLIPVIKTSAITGD